MPLNQPGNDRFSFASFTGGIDNGDVVIGGPGVLMAIYTFTSTGKAADIPMEQESASYIPRNLVTDLEGDVEVSLSFPEGRWLSG